MKTILTITLVLLIFVACEKDEKINYDGFTPISEESVYDSLQLAEEYVYYEIRDNYCYDSTRYNVISSKGAKPYTDSVFSASNKGVYYSSGNWCVYNNVLIYDGADYVFLGSYSDILNFLGPVDCKGDALFIAHLNGYYFTYNDKESGIKEDNGSFLIYACKLVSMCIPVETDKFLIRVDVDGDIEILKQTVLSKDDNACI
jgi:hypothetical protein